MGQTLTHGVYLPDEGERNCYSGLAANWQILDTSVGTVAEHSTQIAGKAPLVHTHTKADITDLFNSANTWTGLNTFKDGGIRIKDTAAISAGEYGAAVYFQDYQGNRYGYIQPYVTRDNYKNIIIGADSTGRIQINSDVVPYDSSTTNLGTSDKTWKTLNGINPGALSIFNPSATQDPIDVPHTWITDGSAWNTLNVSNMGDGWICLTYLACGTNDYILARFGGTNAGTYPSMIFPATRLADSGYFVYALMPVAKAMRNIYLEIKLDSNAVLIKHSFIPAYGTV